MIEYKMRMDDTGTIRIRIDLRDRVTPYSHIRVYDDDGNLLDTLEDCVHYAYVDEESIKE